MKSSDRASFPQRVVGQREQDDALPGAGANVRVQAHDPNPKHRLYGYFEQFPPMFDQFEPDLFDEVVAPVWFFDLGESLFSRSENAPEPNDCHVFDEQRANLLRSSAHVLPLEPDDVVADFGFEFTFGARARPAFTCPAASCMPQGPFCEQRRDQ